jgi:hypothetical protein
LAKPAADKKRAAAEKPSYFTVGGGRGVEDLGAMKLENRL